MNRIPTEGLKRALIRPLAATVVGLNEQNPDRGIETCHPCGAARAPHRLNEQNPDRGIETPHSWRRQRYALWLE